jgi:hypothetical protein
MVVLMVCESVYNFSDFYQKSDGMMMIGGITFAAMAIIYAFDVYEFIREKTRINSQA